MRRPAVVVPESQSRDLWHPFYWRACLLTIRTTHPRIDDAGPVWREIPLEEQRILRKILKPKSTGLEIVLDGFSCNPTTI